MTEKELVEREDYNMEEKRTDKDTPILVDHPIYDGHGKSIPRHSTVFSDICKGEKR